MRGGSDNTADDDNNVQLRRYVAEVSASAEAVENLQRQGNLNLGELRLYTVIQCFVI